MCLFFYFLFFLFFGGGVLELFWMGEFDSVFFVRAKTSRHFSGAPVYISFCSFFCYNNYYLYFYFYFFDLQRKNKCVPKGEDENEEGIHL